MSARLAALILLGATSLQNPQTQTTTQPQPTGKISGVVTRQDTGRPIPNASVRLIRWEGGLGQQIPPKATDANGRFLFENLREGDYAVYFGAEFFVSLQLGQKQPLDAPRQIELKDAQHFDKADIALPPTTAIAGRLLDEFGDPAPGIVVQLAQVQFAAGKRRLMPVGSAQPRPTDDLGQFRVFNLPPGDYYVLALAGPFAGPEDPSGFAVTYYPGTRAPLDARPVHLDIGQDVTGLVFQLAPAPMSTVSGILIDEKDLPISSGSVMLLPTSDGDVRSMLMGRLATGADGAFRFRNVAPGTYVIQAYGRVPAGGPGNLGAAPFTSLPVTVESGGGDVTNLRVKFPPSASARGRIVFEGDGPPAPGRVIVSPRVVNFASGPAGGGPPVSVTNADWTFEVKNMSSVRVIDAIVGGSNWTLKRVTRDGRDITDQPVDFSNGDVDGLEITLTNRVTTLTGSVADDGRGPVTDSTIVVFSVEPTRWTFPSRHFGQARPGPTGSFSIQRLPPGEYYVAAITGVQGADWQDPESLKQLIGSASHVVLSEGGSSSVALKIVRR